MTGNASLYAPSPRSTATKCLKVPLDYMTLALLTQGKQDINKTLTREARMREPYNKNQALLREKVATNRMHNS